MCPNDTNQNIKFGVLTICRKPISSKCPLSKRNVKNNMLAFVRNIRPRIPYTRSTSTFRYFDFNTAYVHYVLMIVCKSLAWRFS